MIKNIQIVGGNSDIGFCVAKKFAENNFDIHLISKNFLSLQKKKDLIEKNYSVKCKITELDIEDSEKVETFLNSEKDKISILLMAVGYLEKDEVNKEKIMNLNYKSLINYIDKAIVRYGEGKNLNTIIGISSVAGDRKNNKVSTYALSKAYFSKYLNDLRGALFQKDINVITVKPGYVRTKMVKNLNLPNMLVSKPEKIANIIYNSYLKNKKIIFATAYWGIIMLVYNIIPSFIFTILNNLRR